MVTLGIDRLLMEPERVQGRRVGLVSNYSVCDGQLQPVIERLYQAFGHELLRLFSPEHGLYNAALEGEHVASSRDGHTGLAVQSLYGEVRKPDPSMLRGLDMVIFDLQDIGSRYYTNLSTLVGVMEACETAGVSLLVLDRPNPIADRAEGWLVEEQCRSFVGAVPVLARHGLTLGEIARWLRRTRFVGLDLSVMTLGGWNPKMYWDETGLPWVPSSPNTTGLDMMTLYPGTCLFEGVNVSVGRGTAKPFEMIGAPFIDGFALADAFNHWDMAGIRARPVFFVPWRSQYQGTLCQGVQLHVTHRRQVAAWRAGVMLLYQLLKDYPDKVEFLNPHQRGPLFFDLLAGSEDLRTALSLGHIEEIFTRESHERARFMEETAEDRLYGTTDPKEVGL
ncbi:exo-beta-N-acetylmuramidase NamZ domain-containing protein [Sulfobacillus sp. hq2]|uniref:exo-beta-N-acetylmuramidase NamZ family protein n=1 Tax=Sulfobacillus TaxID=28033 RepID=UPI000CD27131|nr:DUF1343 domain-containing protein [Sulfobacillus sp. hq2]MCY0909484.1 DUF1343 domain-containing protein [Sulfobacillus thermotolerans]POB10374.1 hypothetical protein CO251_10530 [Sulfobacillus sp. hq2]